MNVIPINDRESGSPAGNPRRPQLLNSARDTAMGLLRDAFRQMLERADDLLFEFAEKSESNTQQNLYFDAMRELRLKRTQMQTAFAEGFSAAFDRRRRRNVPAKPAAAHAPAKLSLLDDDAVEEDISLAGLVDKIGTSARDELFGLNRRMATLMEVAEIGTEDNPLGPRSIAEAARDAAAGLAVDLKIRLIVLKLFDRYVASNMAGIYAAVNQHLIEHGVLPVIHAEVRRNPAATPRGSAGTPAASTPASQAELLGMLERLLQSGGATDGQGASVPALLLDTASLGALTRLQQRAAVTAADIEVGNGVLRQLRSSGEMPALGPAGDMTIDIVAMLFDYILEDKNIPEAIRAQIARLQIPVLKVALIDREFFSRKSHPARRLLNMIAETALETAGDPAMETGVAEVVEKVVQRIAAEFENDIGLFAESVGALERALADLKRESKLRAGRTARLLDGRARLEHAKQRSRELLDTRLRPEGIPEVVCSFLLTHWKRLLITVYTKDGEDGETMRIAIRTMDELVWSTLPKTTALERDKLTKMLPGLLVRLKKGMEYVSMPNIARSSFLSKLAQVHTGVMRREPLAAADTDTAAPEPHAEVLDLTTGGVAGTRAEIATPACEQASEPSAPQAVPPAAAVAAPTAKSGSSLDPRKKAMLAALMAHVHRTRNATAQGGQATDDAEDSSAIASASPAGLVQAETTAFADPPHPASLEGWETENIAQPELPVIDAHTSMRAEVHVETPASALAILEQARTAAEELRAKLDIEEEVRLADVLPPVGQLSQVCAPAKPADESVLEMTANTFYRMFSAETGCKPGAAAAALEIHEMTLGDTKSPVVAQQDDEHVQKVKKLEPGTWIDFESEDGSVVRGRFTWYCANSDTYLFSDRNGQKLAERTRNGLIAEFRRGSARVAQDGPVLDRAFTRLMDTLNLG